MDQTSKTNDAVNIFSEYTSPISDDWGSRLPSPRPCLNCRGGPSGCSAESPRGQSLLDHSDFSVLSLGPISLFDQPDFVM